MKKNKKVSKTGRRLLSRQINKKNRDEIVRAGKRWLAPLFRALRFGDANYNQK